MIGEGGGGVVVPGQLASPPWDHTSAAPPGFRVLLSGGFLHGSETWVGAIDVAMSMTHVSVSVANNFVHSSTAADQGYHAFGELARFIYCLLQKIKKASTLPLVEQWEEYVVPNHSRFAAIDDENFLVGTRVIAALGKVASHYLQKEFRLDARRFLEDFVNCVLSTVAARSVIGQGLGCFCPAIVVGGDDIAPLQLFNKLLDGLLEKGWTKGSEVEACRAEYQSFVQEQRQLERSSARSRPDVGDVLSFCSAQAGFRAHRHLYKVCIVARMVVTPAPVSCLSISCSCMLQVLQLTTLVIRGSSTPCEDFTINLDRVAINKEEVRGVLLCVQDFVRSPHFTQRNFFSETGLAMLSESVAIADSITSNAVYAPWSVVASASSSQVLADMCFCWDWVVLRRRSAKDTSDRWHHGSTPRVETASRPGVVISDVVDEGRVEYVPVGPPVLGSRGPSKIHSSSSKRKRKITRSSVKLPRRFEVSSPPGSPPRRSLVEDPSFASALAGSTSRGKSRRSERDRRAATVFQMGFP